MFFDADVYKGDSGLYASDLDMFSEVAEVAVTNPSFELYLLLHLDDALEKYVLLMKRRSLATAMSVGAGMSRSLRAMPSAST